MTRFDEFRNESRSDEAGGSRKKYTHFVFSFCPVLRGESVAGEWRPKRLTSAHAPVKTELVSVFVD
jgi:hypothetical protein